MKATLNETTGAAAPQGIQQFLEHFSRLIGSCNHARLPGGFVCIEHFVLQHGMLMGSFNGVLPPFIHKGKRGLCFMNACRLALQSELIYCEGYALREIPVMHAWCIDSAGKVIDITWDSGDAYYGVAIKTDFLLDTVQQQKTYGLLDQPNRWPLMAAPTESWRHPIMDTLKPVPPNYACQI
jgi:hypothetical protein